MEMSAVAACDLQRLWCCAVSLAVMSVAPSQQSACISLAKRTSKGLAAVVVVWLWPWSGLHPVNAIGDVLLMCRFRGIDGVTVHGVAHCCCAGVAASSWAV